MATESVPRRMEAASFVRRHFVEIGNWDLIDIAVVDKQTEPEVAISPVPWISP